MKFKWKLMSFYFVAVFGLFIYLKGFFPVKISSAGFSTADDVPPEPRDSSVLLQLNSEEFPNKEERPWRPYDPATASSRNFTKLVLIVIDSIREDFVFGSKHMPSTPFLRKLMLEGNAASFVARAHAPTVTMPRIKALTTGSLPGYVDVILNLDEAKELKEDNLIRSAYADGRSIVFYGDETWIKLFPGKFKRQEGTSSFFVNDFTTVDRNVTRHLKEELLHPDNFDIMILHYLGLDHIGRIAGPKSPLVDSKLKEMDYVVKQIYESLEKYHSQKNGKSLVVVTGDHGMTEKGSHGGTTAPERNVPLLFLSPGINKDFTLSEIPSEVEQTDIAATLSLLLGLPIPRNSMGKSIIPILQRMNKEEAIHAMQYNCHHLLSLAASSGALAQRSNEIIDPVKLYRDALIAHATWLRHTNMADKELAEAKHGYSLCQQALSESLMSNVASYNNTELGAGMVIMWLGYLAVALLWGQAVLTQAPPEDSRNSPNSPLTWGVLATMGTLVHGLSLLSTSFLEEEHQTWYYMTISFLTILFTSITSEMFGVKLGMSEALQRGFFSKTKDTLPVTVPENTKLLHKGKSEDSMDSTWDFVELESEDEFPENKGFSKNLIKSSDLRTCTVLVAALVAHRILRSWNQTGIQFADRHDTGDWLNEPENKFILSLSLIVGLACLAILLEVLTVGQDPWRRYLTWCGLALVYFFRASTGQVVLYRTLDDSGEQSLGIIPARLLYFCIVAILARLIFLKSHLGSKVIVVRTMDYIVSCVVILGAVLLRPHNVWPLVLNLFLYWSVFRQLWPIMNEDGYKSSDSNMQLGKIVLRTTLCYWFGQMSYFSMGNSNSLANVDVSAGYVGIPAHASSLEDGVVLFLLIFATYVGPLLWTMLCLADSVDVTSRESKISKSESTKSLLAVFSTFAFLRLTPMAFYAILITAMRYHLFVWSVFAPKLLFETASTVIYGILLLVASATAKWLY